jgi:translation initiation factor 5A
MNNFTQRTIVKAGSLKKGDIVVIVDRPYKIVELTRAKTGKHGICKIHITGLDIFTNKKIQTMYSSTDSVETTEVSRKEFELIDISNDDFITLMLDSGNTRSDIKLQKNELCDDLKSKFEKGNIVWITIMSSLLIEEIVSFKIEKRD